MTKIQMTKTLLWPRGSPRTIAAECLGLLNIKISNLFRISIFVFRIYPLCQHVVSGRAFLNAHQQSRLVNYLLMG
jgi:hypothetical protein